MKRFILPMMTVCALFAFTGCSDDDDDTPNYAAEIAGTYSGYTVAKSNYFNYLYQGQELRITANTDGTVNLSLNVNDEWGEYTLEKLAVAKAGTQYTLSGSGTGSLAMSGSDPKEYPFTLEAVIVDTKEATVTFTYSIMGSTTVTFTAGEAPSSLVLAGTYSGYIHAKSNYFDEYYPEKNLVITANEDGTVNYKIEIEVDERNNWGIFDIKNLAVTKNESGAYGFTHSGEQSLVMNGAALGPYAYTAKAGIVSTQDAELAITFGIMGGTTLTFHTGSVPE